MFGGLNIWENDTADVVLDADNLFWAITPRHKEAGKFIPENVLSLYAKVKEKNALEMNDLRFSQQLTAIYIDPTDKCNANCSYCYIPHRIRQRGRSMTREELRFILNKIARYFKNSKRKQVIIFHASEPLLVKEIIFQAISEYRKIFKFGLQTNGILLERQDVKFLKEHRVGVGISLDSFMPAVNHRARFSGERENFFKVVRAIEWFDGYNGLNILTTVTKFNVKDLPGLIIFLHSKKVSCVLLNPVRFTRAKEFSLKPDEKVLTKYFIKAVDTAVELSKSSKNKIIIGNFANTILAIIAPAARRLMCDISPCGGGRCFFTITASGKIIPCGEFIGLKGFSGGNIFKTTITEAMHSEGFKKVRARVTEKIAECNICNFRNICGAPCPAELYSLGKMYEKSVFCNFYKEIIKYAFKKIAEGDIEYLLRNQSPESLEYAYSIKNENYKSRG